jgi:hypothetical protein
MELNVGAQHAAPVGRPFSQRERREGGAISLLSQREKAERHATSLLSQRERIEVPVLSRSK